MQLEVKDIFLNMHIYIVSEVDWHIFVGHTIVRLKLGAIVMNSYIA